MSITSNDIILVMGVVGSFPLQFKGALLAFHRDPKIVARGCLWSAAGMGMLTLASLLSGREYEASVPAALGSIWLWLWWRGGGGDGMKRRLKAVAGSFGLNPAPQGA